MSPSPEHSIQIVQSIRDRGVAATAAQFDISDSTVRRYARAAGLRLRIGRPRSRDLVRRNAEIYRLRQEGSNLDQIGAQFPGKKGSLTAERVRQILIGLGGDPLQPPVTLASTG